MKSQLPAITISKTAAEIIAQPDRSPQPTKEEENQRRLQCMKSCAARIQRWLESGTGTEFRFAMPEACGSTMIAKYGDQLTSKGFEITFSAGLLRIEAKAK